MATESAAGSAPLDRESDREARIEEIVAGYVERLNLGEEIRPDDVLAQYPDLAGEILDHLQCFLDFTPESDTNEPLGTLGDYKLLKLIGRGGMGIVYEAWQNSMDRRVALKVMPKAVAADTQAVRRFIIEAQAAGKLSHPNIVQVHGMGVEQQVPYYAMDFVEGETLARILATMRVAKPAERTAFGVTRDDQEFYLFAARCFADVADGLQHAHSKGITHRDIKPSNLILDRERRLRILDFGLARIEGQESITISGDIVGTPQYMSPEQARRKKIPVDHRTDIYSLGTTLYELIVGRPPFQGKDHEDTLSQIIGREPVEPRKLNPRIPRDLETIVLKCLRKDPGNRYGTAEALGQDLRRFVRGDPIEARPQPRWERLARRLWRQKNRVLAVLLTILFLGAAGLLIEVQMREARERSEELYRNTVVGAILKLQVGQMVINAQDALAFDPYSQLSHGDSRVTSVGGGLNPVGRAIEDLERAIAAFPGKPDAHYQRARALRLLGEEGEALKALDDALRADRGFVPARVLRSMLQAKAGNRGEARRAEAPPAASSAEDVWRTAILSASEHRWKEAAAAYSRLLKLEPRGRESYLGSSLEARLGRGHALLEAKEYFRASEEFACAAALWPDLVEAALLKGEAYYLMGNHELAEEAFEETWRSAAFPDDVARVMTILYGAAFHDSEKALAWAKRVKEDGLRHTNLAACYAHMGSWKESAAEAQAALEQDPENVPAMMHLSVAQKNLGRLKDAATLLRRAIALHPRNPKAHSKLGLVLSAWGKPEEAFEECRTARALNPRFLDARLTMLGELADRLLMDEAQVVLEEVRNIAPRSSQIPKYEGVLHAAVGNYDEAEKCYRQAVELNPTDWSLYSLRGDNLMGQKKPKEALQMYEKALELNLLPEGRGLSSAGEPSLRASMGLALEAVGRPEEALREYCQAIQIAPFLWAKERLPVLLLRLGDSPAVGRLMDDLGDRLEEVLDQEYPWVPHTLALARIHGAQKRDLEKALQYLPEDWATGVSRPWPVIFLLADCQFQRGEREKAIRTLEKALRKGWGDPVLEDELAEFRRRSLPCPASYTSIDDALWPLKPGEPGEAKLLEDCRVSEGEQASRRVSYLEARIVERAGRPLEAAGMLREIAALDPESPEPVLRLAECLRAAGDAPGAERELRAWLEKGPGDSQDVWSLWGAVSLGELKRSAAEFLEVVQERPEAGGGEDLRWLLEQLVEGRAIRILCGSDVDRTSNGVSWSRDRFFGGGFANRFKQQVKETAEPVLYETERCFSRYRPLAAAYRVPLPPGACQVTLHLAEQDFREPGSRSFGVRIEGEQFLEDHDLSSVKGFGVADRQEFNVEVKDGMLDIEFVHGVETPVSAPSRSKRSSESASPAARGVSREPPQGWRRQG